jgi:hypothetical protein
MLKLGNLRSTIDSQQAPAPPVDQARSTWRALRVGCAARNAMSSAITFSSLSFFSSTRKFLEFARFQFTDAMSSAGVRSCSRNAFR